MGGLRKPISVDLETVTDEGWRDFLEQVRRRYGDPELPPDTVLDEPAYHGSTKTFSDFILSAIGVPRPGSED